MSIKIRYISVIDSFVLLGKAIFFSVAKQELGDGHGACFLNLFCMFSVIRFVCFFCEPCICKENEWGKAQHRESSCEAKLLGIDWFWVLRLLFFFSFWRKWELIVICTLFHYIVGLLVLPPVDVGILINIPNNVNFFALCLFILLFDYHNQIL